MWVHTLLRARGAGLASKARGGTTWSGSAGAAPPAVVRGGVAGDDGREEAANVVAGGPEAPEGAALAVRVPGRQDARARRRAQALRSQKPVHLACAARQSKQTVIPLLRHPSLTHPCVKSSRRPQLRRPVGGCHCNGTADTRMRARADAPCPVRSQANMRFPPRACSDRLVPRAPCCRRYSTCHGRHRENMFGIHCTGSDHQRDAPRSRAPAAGR